MLPSVMRRFWLPAAVCMLAVVYASPAQSLTLFYGGTILGGDAYTATWTFDPAAVSGPTISGPNVFYVAAGSMTMDVGGISYNTVGMLQFHFTQNPAIPGMDSFSVTAGGTGSASFLQFFLSTSSGGLFSADYATNFPTFTMALPGAGSSGGAPAVIAYTPTGGATFHVGASATSSGVVPEPATLLLFGSGLVGSGGLVRRRKKLKKNR